VYGLGLLAAVSLALSAVGTLNYSFGSLLGSLVLLSVLCVMLNNVLGALYRLPVNQESALITGLLLFFIMLPPSSRAGWLALVVAGVAAMASKYVITWRHASILNPAAVGALVVSLTKLGSAGWWVANKPLFVLVLITGFLTIRKLRRFSLLFCFAVPAILINVYWLTHDGTSLGSALQLAMMSYPVLFLGAFMLTEPSSMPQTNQLRLLFGVIVGFLFASRLHVDYITASPHLSLIFGNIFAFAVSSRAAVRLRLVSKTEIGPHLYDFAFTSDKNLRFTAGQYMEWTLPSVKIDSRGNRRTFTIASSPLEKLVHVSLKEFDQGSAFKNSIMELKEGDYIDASHVAGDFVLPESKTQKIIFIAGGIGVTPFRSHAADMILHKETREIVLFYLANTTSDIVYKDVWKVAARYGLKMVPLTDGVRLDAALLASEAPDYLESLFYISGPPPMVSAYKKMLKDVGVASSRMHTDYFSGY